MVRPSVSRCWPTLRDEVANTSLCNPLGCPDHAMRHNQVVSSESTLELGFVSKSGTTPPIGGGRGPGKIGGRWETRTPGPCLKKRNLISFLQFFWLPGPTPPQ